MRKFWIAASLSLLAMTAQAQQLPPECRVLPDHKAQNDVAYKSGVDVRGKPVVPADINAAPMGFNETIVVPLSVDLAERLGNQNTAGLEMTGTLGFLEIHPDGRVAYNGQDLTPQVYALCGKTEAKAQENPATAAPPADRQTPPDTVKSESVKKTKPVPVPVLQAPLGELIEGADYND